MPALFFSQTVHTRRKFVAALCAVKLIPPRIAWHSTVSTLQICFLHLCVCTMWVGYILGIVAGLVRMYVLRQLRLSASLKLHADSEENLLEHGAK